MPEASDGTFRDNIVARFITSTAIPIYRKMDTLSIALIAFFLFVCLITALLQSGVIKLALSSETGSTGDDLWAQYYWVCWYSAWVMLVLAIVNPLVKIFEAREPDRLTTFVTAAVSLVIVFVLISIVVLAEYHAKSPQAITTLLAGLTAAAMVGVGWTVHAEVAHRTARRNHTFDVIMQSRLSAVFQEHIQNREAIYPPGQEVDKEDAAIASPQAFAAWRADKESKLNDLEESAKLLEEETGSLDARESKKLHAEIELGKKKHQALLSLRAILNYYEFVAAGVHTRDLDEELLKKWLRSILIQLHNDSKHVIRHFREFYIKPTGQKQHQAFSELEKLVASWINE